MFSLARLSLLAAKSTAWMIGCAVERFSFRLVDVKDHSGTLIEWPVSPLYKLGTSRVVFTDWDELWAALVGHWATDGGIPGFGDWSPMLNELDPFRDGRATERLGTYIQWLIEGFNDGLKRDAAMAAATERHRALWGQDKMTEAEGNLWNE